MKNESKSNIKTKTSKKNVKKETKKKVKKETKKNVKKVTKKNRKIVGGLVPVPHNYTKTRSNINCKLEDHVYKYESAFGINPKAYDTYVATNQHLQNKHIYTEFKVSNIHPSSFFRTFEGCMTIHLPSGFILGGLHTIPEEKFQIGDSCKNLFEYSGNKEYYKKNTSLKPEIAKKENNTLSTPIACMDYHFIQYPPFLYKEHALLKHLVTTHNTSDNVKGGQKLIHMHKLISNSPPLGFKNIKLLGYMSDRNKAQHQNIQKQIVSTGFPKDHRGGPMFDINPDSDDAKVASTDARDYISLQPTGVEAISSTAVPQQRPTNKPENTKSDSGVLGKLASSVKRFIPGIARTSSQGDENKKSSLARTASAPPLNSNHASMGSATLYPQTVHGQYITNTPQVHQVSHAAPPGAPHGAPGVMQPEMMLQGMMPHGMPHGMPQGAPGVMQPGMTPHGMPPVMMSQMSHPGPYQGAHPGMMSQMSHPGAQPMMQSPGGMPGQHGAHLTRTIQEPINDLQNMRFPSNPQGNIMLLNEQQPQQPQQQYAVMPKRGVPMPMRGVPMPMRGGKISNDKKKKEAAAAKKKKEAAAAKKKKEAAAAKKKKEAVAAKKKKEAAAAKK